MSEDVPPWPEGAIPDREPPALARERLDTLSRRFAETRTEYERLDGLRKLAAEALDAATADLFDALEQLGLRSIRTARLGIFSLNDLADAKVEDPAAFVEWAKREAPEILHPNYQRLSKLVRDALKGDYEFPGTESELPPGVTYRTRRGITWRSRPNG